MHDFGHADLRGVSVIVKERTFYKPCREKERTFRCSSGPGCTQESGDRKILGTWLDGMKDHIDSYAIEFALLNGKRVRQVPTGDPEPERPVPVPEPKPVKSVRRKR